MLSRLCSLFPIIHREVGSFGRVAKKRRPKRPLRSASDGEVGHAELTLWNGRASCVSKNGLGGELPQPGALAQRATSHANPDAPASQESKQSYRNTTALTLVTEGPRGGAVMRAIGYLTICATIGGILALSTPFTERRSIKTWAPNVVVAAPKPAATVINAPQSPAAAVAMVDALKPSHVARNGCGGRRTHCCGATGYDWNRSPGNRCAAEASRSGDAGGSASEFSRGSETPARVAPLAEIVTASTGGGANPRDASSVFPRADPVQAGRRKTLRTASSALDQSSREALSLKRPPSDELWGHEHCCSKRQPQPRPLMCNPAHLQKPTTDETCSYRSLARQAVAGTLQRGETRLQMRGEANANVPPV